MANTYIATTSDGTNTVFRRKSANRTYTHTVVFQRSKDAAIAYAKSAGNRSHHASTGKYLLDCVADGHHANLMRFEHYAKDTARQAKDVAEAKARLAGITTVAAYVDRRITENLADIAKVNWSAWYNAGWCGRLDLAQKLAAKINNGGQSAVVILEAIRT